MSNFGSVNTNGSRGSRSIYDDNQLMNDSGDYSHLVESQSSFTPELTPSSSDIAANKTFYNNNNNYNNPDDKNISKTYNGGTATIPALTFTLANTILGAGVLGVSHAYSEAGYILGFLLLLTSGTLSAFGLHLLQESARTLENEDNNNNNDDDNNNSRIASFYSVAHRALPSLTIFIDLAIAIKCFGVAISYLIVIGDLMPTAYEQANCREPCPAGFEQQADR